MKVEVESEENVGSGILQSELWITRERLLKGQQENYKEQGSNDN